LEQKYVSKAKFDANSSSKSFCHQIFKLKKSTAFRYGSILDKKLDSDFGASKTIFCFDWVDFGMIFAKIRFQPPSEIGRPSLRGGMRDFCPLLLSAPAMI